MPLYSLVRPLLFSLNAETSHNLVMNSLGLVSRSSLLCNLIGSNTISHPVEAMGIRFPNPVGLAAGLDKQGKSGNALAKLGFGFIELGTVTPLPQPGNPRPRLFRLTPEEALINRMGFNSIGLDRFVNNIKRLNPGIITGINIGKNAVTSLNNSAQDYIRGMTAVYDHADYICINISSPNTEDLRDLQREDLLNDLLGKLNSERMRLQDQTGKSVPLVVKIAPDINQDQIQHIATILRSHRIDAVAATNTTVSRSGIHSNPLAKEVGGLSGKPLQVQSTEVISRLYQNLQDEIPIIGIGGIHDSDSALEKFQAGARLIQLYTGFIYNGPKLISDINKKLNL